MIRISLIAVGKIKEKYLKDAVSEYTKRLGKYAKLTILEVEDEKTPEQAGAALKEQILKKEAGRIHYHLKPEAVVISLEIDGKVMDSEKFAAYLAKQAVGGISHLQFIIGGSLGLHQTVKERADMRLSFSALTFPHQLMRVIVLEQIYRAFRINNGEPYHK